MAWTAAVFLIVVREDGSVESFNTQGKRVANSSGIDQASDSSNIGNDENGMDTGGVHRFGREVAENGIAKCCIWERGVALVTHNNQVWISTYFDAAGVGVTNILRPSRKIFTLGKEEIVLAMCVLDSRHHPMLLAGGASSSGDSQQNARICRPLP